MTGETAAMRAARVDAMIASRVPDVRFLLDRMLDGKAGDGAADIGLALAHLDATLRRHDAADRFLAGDLEAALAARGVEAIACRPAR
jgi:hypothetical protein